MIMFYIQWCFTSNFYYKCLSWGIPTKLPYTKCYNISGFFQILSPDIIDA